MAESAEDDVTVEVVAEATGEAAAQVTGEADGEGTGDAVAESSGEAPAEDGSGDASREEGKGGAVAGIASDRGTMRAFVQTRWGELEEDTSELATMPIPSLPSPKHVRIA